MRNTKKKSGAIIIHLDILFTRDHFLARLGTKGGKMEGRRRKKKRVVEEDGGGYHRGLETAGTRETEMQKTRQTMPWRCLMCSGLFPDVSAETFQTESDVWWKSKENTAALLTAPHQTRITAETSTRASKEAESQGHFKEKQSEIQI